MLSLMPPSTLTYLRTSVPSTSTSLIVPTVYSVVVDGPTMERPGSIATTGIGIPNAPAPSETMSANRAAISAMGNGSSTLVYAMPNPPPRFSSGTGPSASSCACSANSRRAASAKPLDSKICEPICECRPRNWSEGCARMRATRVAASASGMPNFWSSRAVARYSWVDACTPLLMRRRTG